MIREFLAKLLIRNAMAFETSKQTFYRRAAAIVADERARALAVRAAAEEEAHRARLEDLLEHVGGEAIRASRADELGKLGLEEVAGRHEVRPDSTPAELLQSAVELEQSAYDFYYLLARRAKLPVLKETFAALATEEHEHLAAMKQELSRALADPAARPTHPEETSHEQG